MSVFLLKSDLILTRTTWTSNNTPKTKAATIPATIKSAKIGKRITKPNAIDAIFAGKDIVETEPNWNCRIVIQNQS